MPLVAENAFGAMSSPDSDHHFAAVNALSVLVVEPTRDDLLPIVSLLSGTGFRVTATETYAHARNILAATSPAVLITTVRLGEFNGLHLVLRTKTANPTIAALVTSPTADPVLRADAEAMGATFMVKPIQPQELLAAVLRTLYRSDDSGPIRPPFERRVAESRVAAHPVAHERRRAERRRDLSSLVRN